MFASVRIGAEEQCRSHWFSSEALMVGEREEGEDRREREGGEEGRGEIEVEGRVGGRRE